MRLAGGAGEVRGHREHERPVEREDPVELREPDVVADAQPDTRAVGGFAGHDLVARLVAVGLAVVGVADGHIEEVHLAVDGLDLAVGGDVEARVRELVVAVAALADRTGDQVDAELAGELARPAGGRARLERLGGSFVVLRHPAQVEALRQGDERGAVGSRGAHKRLGACEIPLPIRVRVDLNGGRPHPMALPQGRGSR